MKTYRVYFVSGERIKSVDLRARSNRKAVESAVGMATTGETVQVYQGGIGFYSGKITK